MLSRENLIERHVRGGCLSDIPPGIGTNRNESLHKKIPKWMKKRRIGICICLSVALLSMIFYMHMEKNSKLPGKGTKRQRQMTTPISEW